MYTLMYVNNQVVGLKLFLNWSLNKKELLSESVKKLPLTGDTLATKTTNAAVTTRVVVIGFITEIH